jgi:hypothetical protein
LEELFRVKRVFVEEFDDGIREDKVAMNTLSKLLKIRGVLNYFESDCNITFVQSGERREIAIKTSSKITSKHKQYFANLLIGSNEKSQRSSSSLLSKQEEMVDERVLLTPVRTRAPTVFEEAYTGETIPLELPLVASSKSSSSRKRKLCAVVSINWNCSKW